MRRILRNFINNIEHLRSIIIIYTLFSVFIFCSVNQRLSAQYYNLGDNPVIVNQINMQTEFDTVICSDILNMKQYMNFPFQENVIYELAAPVTVAWIIPTDYGAVVYANDISGGLMILSNVGAPIPPFLNVGDNITNVKGILTQLSGNIALIPTSEVNIQTSQNEVYPQSIDLSIMMLNPDIYESALVNIGEVEINGSGLRFKPNNHYIIYQDKLTSAINTIFPNANYLNAVIPGGPTGVTGIVNFNRFTGEVTITPRSMSDFFHQKGGNYKESWLPDDFFFADGYLHINSGKRQPIQIYNIMGEMVNNKFVEQGVTEMKINKTGVYIVKLGSKTGRISVP